MEQLQVQIDLLRQIQKYNLYGLIAVGVFLILVSVVVWRIWERLTSRVVLTEFKKLRNVDIPEDDDGTFEVEQGYTEVEQGGDGLHVIDVMTSLHNTGSGVMSLDVLGPGGDVKHNIMAGERLPLPFVGCVAREPLFIRASSMVVYEISYVRQVLPLNKCEIIHGPFSLYLTMPYFTIKNLDRRLVGHDYCFLPGLAVKNIYSLYDPGDFTSVFKWDGTHYKMVMSRHSSVCYEVMVKTESIVAFHSKPRFKYRPVLN